MRVNRFLARTTDLSRRAADEVIAAGKVQINGQTAGTGQLVERTDSVELDGIRLAWPEAASTIMLNKPAGYVVSRRQQGAAPTIYSLLPEQLHGLQPVGRLDKESRGLLLLTNDGILAQRLTHPSYQKRKVYRVTLNQQLSTADMQNLERGVELADGPSRLAVTHESAKTYTITMQEGRNRQIRRTFSHLGYEVVDLLRTDFGHFTLSDLKEGEYQAIEDTGQEAPRA